MVGGAGGQGALRKLPTARRSLARCLNRRRPPLSTPSPLAPCSFGIMFFQAGIPYAEVARGGCAGPPSFPVCHRICGTHEAPAIAQPLMLSPSRPTPTQAWPSPRSLEPPSRRPAACSGRSSCHTICASLFVLLVTPCLELPSLLLPGARRGVSTTFTSLHCLALLVPALASLPHVFQLPALCPRALASRRRRRRERRAHLSQPGGQAGARVHAFSSVAADHGPACPALTRPALLHLLPSEQASQPPAHQTMH